jgi:hypothetical protein
MVAAAPGKPQHTEAEVVCNPRDPPRVHANNLYDKNGSNSICSQCFVKKKVAQTGQA